MVGRGSLPVSAGKASWPFYCQLPVMPVSVLLVDDDVANLAMLGLALRKASFRVTTATSGPEAIERLPGAFDWLLTDLTMIPMDGVELAAHAKRLQPSLRVILVSALVNDDGDVSGNFDRYVSKPVDTERLIRTLGA